ncbi:MAG: hypothetical protein K8I02_10810 [Candidatus Methylomirabilis sp.]|nr:hypothetical protein [Deltaproteobacteria bacterium]
MDVAQGGRNVLMHGLSLIFAGLLWGLAVPFTPYPRLGLVAHIQFEVNGLLLLAMGTLLLALPHRVGPKSVRAMTVAAWLVWPMIFSQIANAWWGTTRALPIAGAQAGVTGGAPWQEALVYGAHGLASVALILAWALLVAGFAKGGEAGRQA